ncbi:hypothetical protein CVS40_2388 [Lucilia cuprina]|nr:hypothetical protein CVS40_2388 [Lucilia cuprina]KAI8128322.1 hypothetical protein CVS40_2388 [Lucilia cuprina]
MQSYGDARFRSYGFDTDMEMDTEVESQNVAAVVKSKSTLLFTQTVTVKSAGLNNFYITPQITR